MIHLFFPVGNGSGWDTCGKYLTLELSKIGDVTLVTGSRITPETIGAGLEYAAISQIPLNSLDSASFDQNRNLVKGVSLRTLNDFDLSLWLGDIRSERTIGYTFYLGSPLPAQCLAKAKTLDLIVAGSSFCERQLNCRGIDRTKTIVQGINPQIFNPVGSSKTLLEERFVIFSGGKFEFRKGQDIVLRAFKVFSDRHPDALLVNAWYNFWEFSLDTMAASTLIDYQFDSKNYAGSMKNLYHRNGIDEKKVITLPMVSSFQLPSVFKNSDVGLFPNRCEGGTNLMLMEYMACGKPVIASAQTGHADIVRDHNAFPIKNYRVVKTRRGDPNEYADWVEPDVEEVLHHLETAYDHPDLCRQKGEAAGRFLGKLTWKTAAEAFHQTVMEFMRP